MLKNITSEQANFLRMLENNPSLENDMYFVNSLGQDRIIATIRKLANIAPTADIDKISYLSDLLSYVEIMLHGDRLELISRGEALRPHAKQALMSLIEESHSIELDSYMSAKESLQSELEKLQSEHETALRDRDSLESANDELRSKKERLSKEIDEVSSELEALQKRREQLMAEGDRETEKIVESKRQKKLQELDKTINATIAKKNQELKDINAQIEASRKEKETIQSAISTSRDTLGDYQTKISNILNYDGQVRWENISDDDPIYNTNYQTINPYIDSLKRVYMERTGESKEDTDEEFKEHCPGLQKFISLLCSFNNDEVEETVSLRRILECNDWDKSSKYDVEVIRGMLANFKLPQYPREISLDFQVAMQNKTLPNNIQTLMTVLYWQRRAAEESAARKIAEAELQAIVMTFKDAIPANYDFGISANARRAITNRTIFEFLNSVDEQLRAPDKEATGPKSIEEEER